MRKLLFWFFLCNIGAGIEAYTQRIPVNRIRERIPVRETQAEAPGESAVPGAERATLYPGAMLQDGTPFISSNDRSYGLFYTDDPLESVRDYYTRETGEPIINERGGMTYVYKFQGAFVGTDRVRISDRSGNTHPDISYVLLQLEDAAHRGLMTQNEYNEVSQEYNSITGFWKKGIPAEEILPRYRSRLEVEYINDETEPKINALLEARKYDEALEFGTKSQERLEAAEEISQTRQYVDQWKKCLEEIRVALDSESSWNVWISIYEID